MIYYSKINDSEADSIKREFKQYSPKQHLLKLENLPLETITEQQFDSLELGKELAFAALNYDLKEVIKFTARVINHVDENYNLVFITENNVFLNLYKKAEIQQIDEINRLLRQYLEKSYNNYPLEWIYLLNLLSKYEDKEIISKLFSTWINTTTYDINEYQFSILYFKILLNIKHPNELLLDITTSKMKHSLKLSLLFQLVKKCELGDDANDNIKEIISEVPADSLNYPAKVFLETIKKDIDSNYIIDETLFYLYSDKEIIHFLESKLNNLIPNYAKHLIEIQLNGYFPPRNEAILSWILQYSNYPSAYYAEPDYITNDFYFEVFKAVFDDLDITNTSYLKISTEGENTYYQLVVLVGNELFKSQIFRKDNNSLVGKNIESAINEILEILDIKKKIHQIEFDYPLYIVATKENIALLKDKFCLAK